MRILKRWKARLIRPWLSAVGLSLMIMLPSVQAQTTAQAAQEIQGLLDFVEHTPVHRRVPIWVKSWLISKVRTG